VRRGALFAGVMLGTCLVVLAYMDGARPALPFLPHALGVLLGAIVVWLVFATVVTALAEVLRRHHKAIASQGWRHGKRGTIAAARVAGKGGRSATSSLTAWASRRWDARRPVTGGMGWAEPGATAERQATRRPDGKPETDADARFFDLRESGYTGPVDQDGRKPLIPASAPAPAVPARNGDTMASRINPDRRAHRAASSSGGTVPSEWGPVVATAADFEPESDEHLLAWMNDQTAGMAAYAEGLIEAYETGTSAVGIDPKALAALHDVADAAAHCAEIMNAAKGKFTEHYELPREFAANGGQMTHNGRWVTGEGG
jgi:hypothetical protein